MWVFFPFKVVSEGGKANTKNGLCILAQNIVNEKVRSSKKGI